MMKKIRELKIYLRRQLISLLVKLLLEESPLRGELSTNMYISTMSKLHQNPGFIQYCTQREDYLIKQTMNFITNDKLVDAKGITGQLLELRSLQERARVCYYKSKEK